MVSYRDEKADRESQKLNEELKKEKLLQEKLKRKDLERKDLIADEKLISREEYELFAAECVIEEGTKKSSLKLPTPYQTTWMMTRRRFTLRAFTKIDRVKVIYRTTF